MKLGDSRGAPRSAMFDPALQRDANGGDGVVIEIAVDAYDVALQLERIEQK